MPAVLVCVCALSYVRDAQVLDGGFHTSVTGSGNDTKFLASGTVFEESSSGPQMIYGGAYEDIHPAKTFQSNCSWRGDTLCCRFALREYKGADNFDYGAGGKCSFRSFSPEQTH